MTKTVKVEIRPEIINPAYRPHLNNLARTQIYYGGSGSGKSVFLAQRVVYDVMNGGRNYLVCRQVGRTLRGSVFTEITRIITEWGVTNLFTINKSDMLITCANGYQVIFAGLDDVEKLKSLRPAKGVITDVWVEEATETEREAIKQLYIRQRGGSDETPKRLTLSFNPIIQEHWIYQEYFAGRPVGDTYEGVYQDEPLTILKTWYIHNKYLTEADRKRLENEKDDYFYQVYTLGNWGVLGDVIFRNWEEADLADMRDQFTNRKNGLDFGFSSDPAAAPFTHYEKKNKTIYVFDELYQTGLTNDRLAEELKPLLGNDYIVCDSAEPKSIAELRTHGVNALAAKKGKDSVIFGIQWLQQQRIVVDRKCVNMISELRQYQWKKDAAGNSIRQPVDKKNHLIDALRYAYEDESMNNEIEVGDVPFYD